MIALFVGYVPVLMLVAYVSRWIFHTFIPAFVLAFAWMAAWMIFMGLWLGHRCGA